MTVVVRLAPVPEDAQASVVAATALGVRLTRMHPGTWDAELASWYVATSDSRNEEATAVAMRGLPGVYAAYVRPGAEPA